MYPNVNITMPSKDVSNLMKNLNDVFTSMAGAMPVDGEDYTASEDIMDISSYAPQPMSSSPHPMSTHQHAIPTSVITPTSLTSGWLPHPNNNIHGGNFIPPSVSAKPHLNGLVGRHVVSRTMHHGHVRSNDMDMMRMSPSTSRRRVRDDELQPDERDKRRVRRERNKLAAAKCRQRRVDHTNTLIGETEDWEEKNATLEQEISKLHQQKEQLEFILEAHKAMCRQNKTNKQAANSCSLDTPTTEVVTPTSMFNYSLSNGNGLGPGESMMSCGREAIHSESSGSDMSSPEPNRTLIQL